MKGRSKSHPAPCDGAVAGSPTGPAQHVWDGRLLQAEGFNSLSRRVSNPNCPEPHQQPAKGTIHSGQALSHHKDSKTQEPPMTPPRISGVSLAPVPGMEHLPEQPEQLQPAVAAHQRKPSLTAQPGSETAPAPPKAPSRRNLPVTTIRPPVAPAAVSFGVHVGPAAAAKTDQQAQSKAAAAAEAMPMLVAEGKAVSLARGGSLQGGGHPLMQSLDPLETNLLHYREIHDSDSVCGTPPVLDPDILHRDFDFNLPLGPLSPSPLSPSLLTLCGGLDTLDVGTREGSVLGGSNWDATVKDLPDMRMGCDTPLLRTCHSPKVPN